MALDRFMAWIAAGFVALFNAAADNAFAARAIDSYHGSQFGYPSNYQNVADARAPKGCRANWTVVLTFQNTCAAFAPDQRQANGAGG
jgi:hypothetical protein